MSVLSTGAHAENFTTGEIAEFDKEACLDWLIAYVYGTTNYDRLMSVLVREEPSDLRRLRQWANGIATADEVAHMRSLVDAVGRRYAELTPREEIKIAVTLPTALTFPGART